MSYVLLEEAGVGGRQRTVRLLINVWVFQARLVRMEPGVHFLVVFNPLEWH